MVRSINRPSHHILCSQRSGCWPSRSARRSTRRPRRTAFPRASASCAITTPSPWRRPRHRLSWFSRWPTGRRTAWPRAWARSCCARSSPSACASSTTGSRTHRTPPPRAATKPARCVAWRVVRCTSTWSSGQTPSATSPCRSCTSRRSDACGRLCPWRTNLPAASRSAASRCVKSSRRRMDPCTMRTTTASLQQRWRRWKTTTFIGHAASFALCPRACHWRGAVRRQRRQQRTWPMWPMRTMAQACPAAGRIGCIVQSSRRGLRANGCTRSHKATSVPTFKRTPPPTLTASLIMAAGLRDGAAWPFRWRPSSSQRVAAPSLGGTRRMA